ncbi:hypothetical protein MTR67_025891 [Solanum verrucosum]|uniref:Tf2-1-like SH3-like domain-containing protein n=1 Tax=Solanum verrucosum TaxID=315347 RepID=A0AAF0QZI9_SOLVR|nr:hypothetical protein MTR67_025891 [Solanum verrucosum]
MLSQVVTNQAGQEKENRQKVANTSRIREFLQMNPLSFSGSSVTEDPENFMEELQKNRVEGAPIMSWVVFEEIFMGCFFRRELKEVKKQKRRVPSSDSAHAQMNRGEFNNQNSQNIKARPAQSKGSMALGGNGAYTCVKYGRTHSKVCGDGSTIYYKCGQDGHFMKEYPKNRQGGGNRGETSPRYIGPYKISKRIVAYELELPSKLAAVHPVFHISMLKKCMDDPSLIIPTENIGIKDGLSYEEIPVHILDRQVRKLRTKEVAWVKEIGFGAACTKMLQQQQFSVIDDFAYEPLLLIKAIGRSRGLKCKFLELSVKQRKLVKEANDEL